MGPELRHAARVAPHHERAVALIRGQAARLSAGPQIGDVDPLAGQYVVDLRAGGALQALHVLDALEVVELVLHHPGQQLVGLDDHPPLGVSATTVTCLGRTTSAVGPSTTSDRQPSG